MLAMISAQDDFLARLEWAERQPNRSVTAPPSAVHPPAAASPPRSPKKSLMRQGTANLAKKVWRPGRSPAGRRAGEALSPVAAAPAPSEAPAASAAELAEAERTRLERLGRLGARFPTVYQSRLEMALKVAHGHAGRATGEIMRLTGLTPVDPLDAPQPRPPRPGPR